MNIKQLIKEAYRLGKQTDSALEIIKATKQKIQQYFEEKDIDTIDVESSDSGVALRAKVINRMLVEYDVEALKENISKEAYSKVVDKRYIINDMASLSKMLKAAGVDAKEFKKYIGVETSVNSSALQQLYSVGDITKQQLKGCYTAKIVKSIRISERKGGTD